MATVKTAVMRGSFGDFNVGDTLTGETLAMFLGRNPPSEAFHIVEVETPEAEPAPAKE